MTRQGYSLSQFSPTADAESSYQRYYDFQTIDASCFHLVFPMFRVFVHGGRENTRSMKNKVGKSYVLKTGVSIQSIYLTDNHHHHHQQPVNKGKFRRILVFLSFLFVSLCPSSVASPPSLFHAAGPRFGTKNGETWLIVVCIFVVLSLTPFLLFLFVYRSLSAGRRNNGGQ